MHVNPLRTVREVLRDEHEVVLECRRCGTKVAVDTEPCSNCGRDSIARYEIR